MRDCAAAVEGNEPAGGGRSGAGSGRAAWAERLGRSGSTLGQHGREGEVKGPARVRCRPARPMGRRGEEKAAHERRRRGREDGPREKESARGHFSF